MKSKILFSALAISAAFVACNNEEIMVNDSLGTNEIVGAKLLGSGLSLGIGAGDADSRATADGWENGVDVAGVAWVTSGTPNSDQNGIALSNVGTTLYANHFYQYNNNVWSTKSNVYEGWHFAYFPYQYQKKAGQLVVEVNALPMTKTDHRADVNDNALKISAAEFLSEDNVDLANGSIDVTYDIARVVNVIKPELQVSSDFTQHPDLQTIKINGVTVRDSRSDKQWFSKEVKVDPSELPTIQYKKYTEGEKEGQYILVDGKKQYDEEATIAQLNYEGLYESKAIEGAARTNTISTVIDGEGFVLDGTKTVRIFLAPVADYTASVENISFEVSVGGGHFDIAYTPAKDAKGNKVQLTAIQETNNAAIEKMVALLNGSFKTDTGKTRSLKTITTVEGELQAAQTIEMALGLENFTADYIIENIDDWNDAVKLANALNKEEVPTFTLKDADAKVEFPAGEMNVPNKGVKVTSAVWGAQLIFKNKTTWNANITGCGEGTTIVVDKTGELTVENALWASRIVNEGTILAGELATVGSKGEQRFDNSKGRVVVEYGAFVYPSTGKTGIIAYNVDGTESAAKINTLVATSGNKNGHAGVNTLIIANGVTLDLTDPDDDKIDDDRYNGAVIDGSVLADMTDVAIEMNGGSIIAKLDDVKNVHNVTVKGGENTIKDVDVMGTLAVEAGSVTIDATEYQIEKIVNSEKVIVDVKDAADVNKIDVKSSAVLNVTVDTYTSDIVNAGLINVTSPYVLRYANTIKQSGSQSGNIVKGAVGLAEALAAGRNITLMQDVVLTGMLTVPSGYNGTIDLNGKTLSFSGDTGHPAIKNTGNLEIVNGKISSVGVGVQNNGTLVVDCDIESVGNAVNNVYDGKTTIEGGSYKNTAADKATIYSDGWKQGTPELIINGGTFESQFTCVSYNNASTGAVNKGTFTTKSEHCIYVGGSEGNCKVTYDASRCTFVNKGNKAAVYVGDMSGTGTKTNTVNGTVYTGNRTVLQ